MNERNEFRSAGWRQHEAMWRFRLVFGTSVGLLAGVVVGFMMGRMM